MKLVPLQQVSSRLRVGCPLPFGVRDAEGKLLLARGLQVASAPMLEALLQRGVFVDMEELREFSPRFDAASAPGEDFFGRWQALQSRLCGVLRSPAERYFLERLRECIGIIAALSERNVDQLIFAVMRHDHSRYAVYGTVHSLHVAVVCALLARRWGWPADKLGSLIGAALTMNLSIIELQGRLASHGGRLTPEQRAVIERHPMDSGALLRQAGLDDADWLAAVEQHHERDDGLGYPARQPQCSEIARLLHFIDIFTAKHAGRADRAPLPPQQAAREFYTASGGHALAGQIIKEFGIFPPGCFVKLKNGETAIVVRRGASANTPLACAITNRNGDALAAPLQRDTGHTDFAIVGSLIDKAVLVRVPVERLYEARAA